MKNLLSWIWLSTIENIGCKKKLQLLNHFGSPENIIMASQTELEALNLLNEAAIKEIRNKNNILVSEKHLENIHKNDIKFITINDEGYPSLLKNIYDPPVVIYYKGVLRSENKTVAVVGSRNATEYGLKTAESISYELSALGITVVSGMARGVDSYAHNGAIKAKGRTIAVLGCGLDNPYPPENRDLMIKITEAGTVLSEYIPGMAPLPKNFPARNRIISGLSLGVVIVEANEKSGSLITADFALEQGREVFAVPGNVYRINSKGTNKLIKDGAKIVTCIDDILEELKFYEEKGKSTEKIDYKKVALLQGLDSEEKAIIDQLENEPVHIDVLAAKSGLTIQSVNAIVIMLELKGILEQEPGKMYKLKV